MEIFNEYKKRSHRTRGRTTIIIITVRLRIARGIRCFINSHPMADPPGSGEPSGTASSRERRSPTKVNLRFFALPPPPPRSTLCQDSEVKFSENCLGMTACVSRDKQTSRHRKPDSRQCYLSSAQSRPVRSSESIVSRRTLPERRRRGEGEDRA